MTTEDAIKWGGGTQTKLAKKLGIEQGSIAGWGDYPPPLRQIQIEKISRRRLKAEADVFETKKAKAA